MRHGEIGFVSPFRYTILLWAILLGFVVFGDIPNAMTMLGSLIVVATGVYTFYRERVLQLRAAATLIR
jgi:drug/metabolite transporter (DMT)-like permease